MDEAQKCRRNSEHDKTVAQLQFISGFVVLWKVRKSECLCSLKLLQTCVVSCRSQGRSSMAGQILEETAFHRVETFGLTIPVQIREALAARNSKKF